MNEVFLCLSGLRRSWACEGGMVRRPSASLYKPASLCPAPGSERVKRLVVQTSVTVPSPGVRTSHRPRPQHRVPRSSHGA